MTRHKLQVQWYRFLYYCIAQPLCFFSWEHGSALSRWVNVQWNKLDPPWPVW